jgi:hypothetical protein
MIPFWRANSPLPQNFLGLVLLFLAFKTLLEDYMINPIFDTQNINSYQ